MNKKQLADQLGLKPRQIDNLVLDGLPRTKRGREWDYGIEAVVWYFTRKIERLEQTRLPSLEEARARKEIAQAELAEYQLAEVRGDMVPQVARERELNLVFDTIRARCQNIPGKYPPRFVNLRSFGEARLALESLASDVLADLSQGIGDDIEPLPIPEEDGTQGAPERSEAVEKLRRRRGAQTA